MGIFGDIGDGLDNVVDAGGDVLSSAAGVAVDVADHAGGAALGTVFGGPVGGIYGATHGVSGLVDKGKDALSSVQNYASGATGGQGDVEPAWGTSQPAWADDLISMCVSFGKWPEGSETALWQLQDAYVQMQTLLSSSAGELNAAKASILAGWDAPAAESFDGWTEGHNAKLVAEAANAGALAAKADEFATETEYTKLAINIAFWITIAEVFAAVCAAFFTFGASLGAGAAAILALRTTMQALVTKLATAAGRAVLMTAAKAAAKKAGTAAVKGAAKGAAIGAAKGVAKDGGAQAIQRSRGTREGHDWGKTAASGSGGLAGGALGGGLGGAITSKFPNAGSKIPPFGNQPANRVTVRGTERYVTPVWNRPVTSAVTSSIAGPAGLGVGTAVGKPLDDVDDDLQAPLANPFTIENMGKGGILKYPVAVGGAVAGGASGATP